MNENGMYPDADAPWLPTYADLIVRQGDEQGPATDYNRYGWNALVVPSDCPYVSNRMETLNTRFEQRYCDRMIAYETWDLWQIKLQERFDSVVYIYNRAYKLYNENASDMDNAVPGRTLVTNDQNKAGGSDSRAYKSKESDTPSSAINESDDFAGSIRKDETTDTYGRTDTRDSTVTEKVTGAGITDAVNQTIDGWRDLDTRFIDEFQDLFAKVWWY